MNPPPRAGAPKFDESALAGQTLDCALVHRHDCADFHHAAVLRLADRHQRQSVHGQQLTFVLLSVVGAYQSSELGKILQRSRNSFADMSQRSVGVWTTANLHLFSIRWLIST